MDPYARLAAELKEILRPYYPDIRIRAEPWSQDPSRTAVYFVESRFADLYPQQRYHYLIHAIPEEFYKARLAETVWFELAPGESPYDLDYHDDEVIADITPGVMRCVRASGFLQALDDVFCPRTPSITPAKCNGDFRLAKELLISHRFKPEELFDILHVLMSEGAYCDCEILYNVAENSRLRASYWMARSEGRQPDDPHRPQA